MQVFLYQLWYFRFYVDPGLGNRHRAHHHPINRSAGEAECLNDIEQDDEDFIKDMADG